MTVTLWYRDGFKEWVRGNTYDWHTARNIARLMAAASYQTRGNCITRLVPVH